MTGELFTVHFVDCQFNKTILLPSGKNKEVHTKQSVLEEWRELL